MALGGMDRKVAIYSAQRRLDVGDQPTPKLGDFETSDPISAVTFCGTNLLASATMTGSLQLWRVSEQEVQCLSGVCVLFGLRG